MTFLNRTEPNRTEPNRTEPKVLYFIFIFITFFGKKKKIKKNQKNKMGESKATGILPPFPLRGKKLLIYILYLYINT